MNLVLNENIKMAQILTNIKSVVVGTSGSYPEDLTVDSVVMELLQETDILVKKIYNKIISENSERNYHEILSYSMNNKRNYERAYFVRFGYELFKPNWQVIANALTSVELRYSSLVVTDDIFDRNDVRMGEKSLPEKVGNNISVSLAGILKSLSSIALTKQLAELNLDANTVNRINYLDEKSHLNVYEGQIMDINTEEFKIEELNEDFYIDMIRKTTGEDVGYCLELGGLLTGCSFEEAEIIRSFGISLGTMMQLRDDIIDYINSRETINKLPFRDFEQKKKRLPLILAYKFATDDERTSIDELLKKDQLADDERKLISDLIFKKEAILYSKNVMLKLKESLFENFDKLNPNERSKEIISEIVNNIVVI